MIDKKIFDILKVYIPVIIVLLLVPFVIGEFYRHVAVVIAVFAILALSWDICARVGLLSFAHAGFFGLGAYSVAIMIDKFGMPYPVAFLAAIVVTALFAVILGYVTLRISGIYFAIGTLAFSEVLRVVCLQLPQWTGGPMGLTIKALFDGDRIYTYYFLVAILVVLIIISLYFEHSRYRLAFVGMRANARVSSVLGVNTVGIRVFAFTLSAAFAGLAGGCYAGYTTSVIPFEVFSTHMSVASIVMPIFGGLYSTIGPIMGAVILSVVEEYLKLKISYGYMIIYGLILIITVMFMPNGLRGVMKKWQFWK
jgi:branched-chain amino acid transport system permease protein